MEWPCAARSWVGCNPGQAQFDKAVRLGSDCVSSRISHHGSSQGFSRKRGFSRREFALHLQSVGHIFLTRDLPQAGACGGFVNG